MISPLARLAVGLLTAYAGLCMPDAAHAATRTASIAVSAEVVDTCHIAVRGVARAPTATCALATPYRVVTGSVPTDATALSDGNTIPKSSSTRTSQQTAGSGLQMMTIIY